MTGSAASRTFLSGTSLLGLETVVAEHIAGDGGRPHVPGPPRTAR